MAATSPSAVASNASAMPGATTARLVVCAFEMPMKLSMMPQTVPNRPTKGAVEPIVARTPVPRATLRLAACSMRSSCQAMRSLRPSPRRLAESRISLPAAGGGATPGRDLDQHRGATVAVGHVPPCHREAGDDRPRRGLARDLDDLAHQMARTAYR